MKLYLVQHGQALSKEENKERPLSIQGHKDIDNLAQFLKSNKTSIQRVVHSGKLRAQQTAEIISKHMEVSHIEVIEHKLSPNADIKAFVSIIDSWQEDTMIIGHLPFMSKLVSYFINNNENTTNVAYLPGSVVCLEKTDIWQINWMIRPELLTEIYGVK